MLAKMRSAGVEAYPVEIEVNVAETDFSGTAIVGLPDAAVKESLERVRAAVTNSGHHRTLRMTINLAPADLRKKGPSFDLPFAARGGRSGRQKDASVVAAEFLSPGIQLRVVPVGLQDGLLQVVRHDAPNRKLDLWLRT